MGVWDHLGRSVCTCVSLTALCVYVCVSVWAHTPSVVFIRLLWGCAHQRKSRHGIEHHVTEEENKDCAAHVCRGKDYIGLNYLNKLQLKPEHKHLIFTPAPVKLNRERSSNKEENLSRNLIDLYNVIQMSSSSLWLKKQQPAFMVLSF